MDEINDMLQRVDKLPLVDRLEFQRQYDMKYSLVFIDGPTIKISLDRDGYRPFWLIPGVGVCEDGSPACESASPPAYLRTVFTQMEKLLQLPEIQEFLDPDIMRELAETAMDRLLVDAIRNGARYNHDTGRIDGFE